MHHLRQLLQRLNTATRGPLFLALGSLVAFGDVMAQDAIEWDGIRQLTLSDFRSPATQIGSGNLYSLQTAASFDFAYQMGFGEFAFTKNFNEKVSCTFRPAASALVAPDSTTAVHLLAFARYQFDLNELYARKLRQRLFEEKDAFSNAEFYRPVYDALQAEMVARHTQAASDTDLGRQEAELKVLHEAVLDEIARMPDYCRTCKPPRKGR